MDRAKWLAPAIALAALTAACASSATPPADGDSVSLQVLNQGGSMEGHTPRGFAGSGSGLFAGDNLDSRFPDGDGVQIWLTFDIPAATPTPERAVLRSQSLTTRGDPFADLGELRAEPVIYDSFAPALFDLGGAGAEVSCDRVGRAGVECDVTDAVVRAIGAGETRAQFRLKFETVSDNDGDADLAMFFLTDSNTNQAGIFTLDLN